MIHRQFKSVVAESATCRVMNGAVKHFTRDLSYPSLCDVTWKCNSKKAFLQIQFQSVDLISRNMVKTWNKGFGFKMLYEFAICIQIN